MIGQAFEGQRFASISRLRGTAGHPGSGGLAGFRNDPQSVFSKRLGKIHLREFSGFFVTVDLLIDCQRPAGSPWLSERLLSDVVSRW